MQLGHAYAGGTGRGRWFKVGQSRARQCAPRAGGVRQGQVGPREVCSVNRTGTYGAGEGEVVELTEGNRCRCLHHGASSSFGSIT